MFKKEVLSLGSKQALSNGNEPEELTDLLQAFEKENQVLIEVSWKLIEKDGKSVLDVRAVARNNAVDDVLRARWVSVVCALPVREYKSLMGAVTTLLYRLDFEIGVMEMQSIGIKRAQHPAH